MSANIYKSMKPHPTTREFAALISDGIKLLAKIEAIAKTLDVRHTQSDDEKLLRKIIETVCAQFAVNKFELTGSSRKQHVSHARQCAFLLARKKTALTFEQIAKVFNRDHGTVIAGIKSAQNRIDTCQQYAAKVNLCEELSK